MYLNILDYKDKKAFFALANRLISIDGNISDEEIDLLEAYRYEMNLLEVDYMAEADIDEILDIVTDDYVIKKIFIYELVTLSLVDSSFSEEEEKTLKYVVEHFEIDEETYTQIKNAVNDLYEVTKRTNDIIISIE